MTTIKSITEAKNLLPTLRAQKSINLRKQYGERTIVLFNDGNIYSAYSASALLLNTFINVDVTVKNNIHMATMKQDLECIFFPRLVKAGLKIAII